MKIWTFLFITAVCISCTSRTKQQSSHLRIISMIPDTEATLSVRKIDRDNQKQTFELTYASPVSYQIISPGSYEFSYKDGDQKVLDAEYVMGNDGWYTLVVTGLMPDEVITNRKTRMYWLEHIFAGSEATGTNGFLPKWFLIRDNYDGSTKEAYLRILNMSPTFDRLKIHKDNKQYEQITYPKETEMRKLKPGPHHFSFYHQKIKVGETEISAKPGYIYTILAGDPANKSPDRLRLPVLHNPSRSLLNK